MATVNPMPRPAPSTTTAEDTLQRKSRDAGVISGGHLVARALKNEGVEPTLILWALSREIRGLWQARERDRLRGSARGSGWNLAAPPSNQALSRMRKLPLARLLLQAHRVDRTIKGLAQGDAWTALTGLTAALAGALQATTESGRVA